MTAHRGRSFRPRMPESTRDRRRTAGTADQAVGSELRKSRSRLAATVVRYALVERMSSIGAMSRCRASSAARDRVLVGRRGGQRGLRLRRAHHRRRNAAERQPDLGDPPLLHARRGRETDFRDRLGAPGADLAIVLDPPAPPRQTHRDDQLIGGEVHLLVAGMEPIVRHQPTATRRCQFDRRVVDEQSRRRIGGRRGIGDVAGNRAPVLIGDAPRVGGGAAEQRKFGAKQLVLLHIREGRQRPDRHRVVRDRDVPQRAQTPHVDELAMRQRPGGELHHQVGAAGERPPGARVLGQDRQHTVERRRGAQRVGREERSHDPCQGRRDKGEAIDRRTASKIFV